jgi:NADP-dependent 3-hydroxy acid dehydrogenase YdfG
MNNKTILITGASSGIGKATAVYLDQLGYKVYAGVRKIADAETLKNESSDQLQPLFLDVAKQASIQEAVELIESETEGNLYGLVNNAGLSLNGPLELLPFADIEQLFQVNVLGLLAMTQAVLPFIRKSQGRIVNISSGHGLLAVPDKSAYAASKFAVQAISDSLRVELHPFGVTVANVVVGKVETAVLNKIINNREKMMAAAPPDVLSLYMPLIEYFDREVKDIPGIPALEVAKVITDALTAEKPKTEYLIGPGVKKMKNLARFPTNLRDKMFYKAIYKA